MKYCLLVDNYRGFNETCLPIAEVNFFVGENSTGKTSLLSILRLLMSPLPLLMGRDFDDGDEANSGNFFDLVSVHSANQQSFSCGLFGERESGKRNINTLTGYILTFTEDHGRPRVARCIFCLGEEWITLEFRGKSVFFRMKRAKLSLNPRDILKIFKSEPLLGDQSVDMRKLVTPRGFPGDLPPLVALSFAQTQLRQGSDKRSGDKSTEVNFSPHIFEFVRPLCWVAPIRSKPKRTYDAIIREFSPEGEHTPYLIRTMLKSRSQAKRFRSAIQKAGVASGLFQDVEIKNFGRQAGAPFEVDIVLDGKALSLTTVGYGVAQSLPVLVELLARQNGSWFAIQQPEVHLHPRAQAALGDVLFEAAVGENKRFLIETHSDFMIDRFRLQYRRPSTKKPESQIIFFERKRKGNTASILPINETGDLPQDQPDSYRKFFIREQMHVLGIQG